MSAALFHSLLEKSAGVRNILDQGCRHIMAPLPLLGAVVGDPDFSFIILRDQGLEGQVDGQAGRGQHQRCAAFRIPGDP